MSPSVSMSVFPKVDLSQNNISSKENAKYISSTERFAQLLQEHNLTQPTSMLQKPVENFYKINTKTNFKDTTSTELLQYDQQLQKQIQTIKSRLESMHNSAQRTTTNIERLSKALKANLPENKACLKNFQDSLDKALKLTGGNLFIIEGLQRSTSALKPYVDLIDQLQEQFDNFKAFLNTIESSTDLIYADAENDTSVFLNSLKTPQIIHNFEPSKTSVRSLITNIENAKVSFTNLTDQLKQAIEDLNTAINIPPSGNIHPVYYNTVLEQKNALKTVVNKNIEFLNRNISLIQTLDKTFIGLVKQLEELNDFISEIESQNNRYLKKVLNEKKAAQLQQITVNGTNATQLVNKSNVLSYIKV